MRRKFFMGGSAQADLKDQRSLFLPAAVIRRPGAPQGRAFLLTGSDIRYEDVSSVCPGGRDKCGFHIRTLHFFSSTRTAGNTGASRNCRATAWAGPLSAHLRAKGPIYTCRLQIFRRPPPLSPFPGFLPGTQKPPPERAAVVFPRKDAYTSSAQLLSSLISSRSSWWVSFSWGSYSRTILGSSVYFAIQCMISRILAVPLW